MKKARGLIYSMKTIVNTVLYTENLLTEYILYALNIQTHTQATMDHDAQINLLYYSINFIIFMYIKTACCTC